MNFRTIISLSFVLFPILDIYATPFHGISIGELILLILFVLSFLRRSSKNLVVYKSLLPIILFYLYGTIITVFSSLCYNWLDIAGMLYDWVGKTIFFIFLLLIFDNLEWKCFKKNLLILADIVSIFLFVQFFLAIIGIHLSGIIPYLPLSNETDVSSFVEQQKQMARFSSFFCEPAHYSQFFILPICLLLYTNNKSYMRIIMYSLSVLLSQSANGFAILLIIYICFCIHKLIELRNIHKKILLITGASLTFVVIIICFSDFTSSMLERFAEINADSNTHSVHGKSSFIRVLRGYILYSEYNFVHQAFGYGFGSILNYVYAHPATAFLDITSVLPDYVNSTQYILLTTGFVGFIFICWQFFNLYNSNASIIHTLLIVLFFLIFSSTIFFTYITISIFYIAVISKQKKIVKND